MIKKLKPSEHQIQSAFFELMKLKYPLAYKLAFAIPNGGFRNIITAKRLKAEGVKAGIADVFVAMPAHNRHGLWLEFKAGSNKMTSQQKEWAELMLGQRYEFAVVYSVEDAEKILIKYIKGNYG